MQTKLKAFFEKENIEFFRSFRIDKSLELKYLKKLPEWAKSGVVFLIPYRMARENCNVSEYAIARDYHLYIDELSQRLEAFLSQTNVRTKLFADNSPFFERDIAYKAGLGFFGRNHMFINEKYGSFIFIGELIADFEIDIFGGQSSGRSFCLDCGACALACPSGCLSDGNFSKCISGLTQQKKLDKEQQELVSKHPLVWGCDICQLACPHNEMAAFTPIEFFAKERIPHIDAKLICEMSEDEFCQRAFSWRGRQVILRNLSLHDTV